MERISDLEELILRCRTDDSKRYIADAYASYKAGAYRSSIVATWIAITFDLIDKIREMSVSGEARAKTWINDFETRQKQVERGDRSAIPKLLDFERDILNTAMDFDLIDGQQFIDLQRVQEDRNRCAHPTFQRIDSPYYPTAEQSRYHIKNAVVHVLQQPPVTGKVALEGLKKIVESEYFPVDVADAKNSLLDGGLMRATGSLVRGLVDFIIYGGFDKDSVLYLKKRVTSALKAILDLHHDEGMRRITSQLSKIILSLEDEKMNGAVSLVSNIPELWDGLSESARAKTRKYISCCSSTEFVGCAHKVLAVKELRSAGLERINGLDVDEIAALIEKGIIKECLDRSVDLYSKVTSWREANSVYSKLIKQIFDELEDSHFEQIISAATSGAADLAGSGGFTSFLECALQSGRVPRKGLLERLQTAGMGWLRDPLAKPEAEEAPEEAVDPVAF